jgi:REP element-mobilizing transposase RayT
MLLYRRRLPHWIPDDTILFVTWRLAGSKPGDQAGPKWLVDPPVAGMLVDALLYGETARQPYRLHAWVIMPNHVHVVWEPVCELSAITRWLKGRTSRTANQILGRTGMPFWQDESYDHWIRSSKELRALVGYVEENPVRAGLVGAAAEWRWSSAWQEADDKNRSSAPQTL